jgi:Zn-dependent protease
MLALKGRLLPRIDLMQVALQYFCLLFSLCVHEAAHAKMADMRGDSTARFLGRVTLDPRKHADPIGTVVMPLLGMITGFPFLFGWARPVPVNPLNLKNRALDQVWIALAGPGSNLIIALVVAIVLRVVATVAGAGVIGDDVANVLILVLVQLAVINFVLILFNLIPVPPLDGHYVLKYFLPPKAEEVFERIGPFGIIIAIFLAPRVVRFGIGYCVLIIEVISGVKIF